MHLIFEETTSVLYYSNDGRLQFDHSDGPIGTFVVKLDGREVFATHDRVKVDAYIAGYDLAHATRAPDVEFQLPPTFTNAYTYAELDAELDK